MSPMRRWRWGLGALPLAAALSMLVAATAPAADPDAGRRKAARCAACHGADGNATIPGTPSLASMPVFYTHWQLIMFRDGRRRSEPPKAALVQNLTDEDMADLSAYYAAQPSRGRSSPSDAALIAAARPLAEAHHCISCHGPNLMGQQQVPRLAGQDLDYLLKRLQGYKAKTTSDLDGMMTMVAQALTEGDIEILARCFAGLDPAGGGQSPGRDLR